MSEKRFAPSQRKLKEARKQGKTERSQVLTQLAGNFGGISALISISWYDYVRYKMLLQYCWIYGFGEPLFTLQLAVNELVRLVACFGGAALITSMLVQIVQAKPLLDFSVIAPQFDRIVSAQGFARIASGFRRLPWMFLRIFIVIALGAYSLLRVSGGIDAMLSGSGDAVAAGFEKLLYSFFSCLVPGLSVIALLDFIFQRRRYRESVYMSIDEVRREHREDEGDAHLKAHRRALHQALSRQEIVRRVMRAKVIIVERNRVGSDTGMGS